MRSVGDQRRSCPVPVQHLLVAFDDGSGAAAAALEQLLQRAGPELSAGIRVFNIHLAGSEWSSSASRCEELRMIGVELSASKWVAFLDVEHEYMGGHLASLLTLLQSQSVDEKKIAHSHRRVMLPSGAEEWDGSFVPGLPPALFILFSAEARQRLQEQGVLEEGSCVVKDVARLPSGDLGTVDHSECVGARAVFLAAVRSTCTNLLRG